MFNMRLNLDDLIENEETSTMLAILKTIEKIPGTHKVKIWYNGTTDVKNIDEFKSRWEKRFEKSNIEMEIDKECSEDWIWFDIIGSHEPCGRHRFKYLLKNGKKGELLVAVQSYKRLVDYILRPDKKFRIVKEENEK